jgi:hypothetical protein
LLAKGVKARVRGRDIGKQILDLVEKISKRKGFSFANFEESLEREREKELARLSAKGADESALDVCADKYAAIMAIYTAKEPESFEQFRVALESLFADDGDNVIWLSTIHRSKGLEAPRTFIVDYHRLPAAFKDQSADQIAQEENLTYVALTRCKIDRADPTSGTMILFVKEPEKVERREAPEQVKAAPEMVAAPVTSSPLTEPGTIALVHQTYNPRFQEKIDRIEQTLNRAEQAELKGWGVGKSTNPASKR